MRLYRRADRDKDGELDAREFARVFDVEASNPFLPRLVRLFDVSGDGKLSPFEFIACLSQFTSSSRANRDAHVAFAWRLFDTNDDGSMSKAEFREALSATYFRRDDAPGQTNGGGRNGKSETSSTARVVGDGGMRRGLGLANFGGTGGLAKGLDAIMHDVDGNKDGRVTSREFSLMTLDYPHVIAPAFDLWTKLGEVGRPATRARREIEKEGNVDRLVALALKSSEARRGETLKPGPERGTSRRTKLLKVKKKTRAARDGDLGRVKTKNGDDDATAGFRLADPRSTRRGVSRAQNAETVKTHETVGAFQNVDDAVPLSRRREGTGSAFVTDPHTSRASPRVFSATEALKPPKIKIRKSSWRLPSFSSPRTPPPPKTAYELEMEAACASTDDDDET